MELINEYSNTSEAGGSALLCACGAVSVLFVRPDSIYKTLGVDCWDIERDARNWPGGNPIIAHPPCRAWGRFAHRAKPRPDEKDLARWAVRQIRLNGGVLEHPAASKLWSDQRLPGPKEVDAWGGYTISVNQSWWGHKAQKKTWLYIVGCPLSELPQMPLNFNGIEYFIATTKNRKRGPRPKMFKWCTKSEREATPIEFAKWLIQVASLCRSRHCT
jgi:hypothetical protein